MQKKLEEYWPGKVSIILPSSGQTKIEHIHRGTDDIAFRIPGDENLRRLLKKTGPLVAPSANTEGLKTIGKMPLLLKYLMWGLIVVTILIIVLGLISPLLDFTIAFSISVIFAMIIFYYFRKSKIDEKVFNSKIATVVLLALMLISTIIVSSTIVDSEMKTIVLLVHIGIFGIVSLLIYFIPWEVKLGVKAKRFFRKSKKIDPDEALIEFKKRIDCIGDRLISNPEIFENMNVVGDQKVIDFHKNLKEMVEFKNKYPDLLEYETKPNLELYNKIFKKSRTSGESHKIG